MNESPDKQRIFDEVARETGRLMKYCEDFIPLRTYDEIFERMGAENITMLDLGAGFVPISKKLNHYVEALENRGIHLIPVEKGSTEAKSWLLARTEQDQQTDTYVSPVKGDVFKLPFQDESVEGAISLNFLNLPMRDLGGLKPREMLQKFFTEVRRVLKHRGFVIISNFGYMALMMADGTIEYHDQIIPSDFVDAKMIEEEAKKGGFSTCEQIPLDPQLIQRAERNEVARSASVGVVKAKIIHPVGLLLRKF